VALIVAWWGLPVEHCLTMSHASTQSNVQDTHAPLRPIPALLPASANILSAPGAHPSLVQVQAEYEEELAALRQQHEAALADERRRAEDAAQAALEGHWAELEALAAKHEQQVGLGGVQGSHPSLGCWCGVAS